MDSNVIPFVFDNWHETYQWWVPNTIPSDFIINGKKMNPATHDFAWFEHTRYGIDTRKEFHDFFSYPARKYDYLYENKNIKFTLLNSDISKYIYPVLIRAYGYFEKQIDIGFNYVSDRVTNDVKNGKAKIVILYAYEGNCSDRNTNKELLILDSWCIKKGFNKSQVYFIHGNHKKLSNIEKYNFTYIPIFAFYNRLQTQVNDIIKYDPVNEHNLFLSYNRRWDKHRQLLLSEIIKNNLLHRGLVSYPKGNTVQHIAIEKGYSPELVDAAKKLESIAPLLLDVEDLKKVNPIGYIVPNHHSKTFLSITTETLYNDDVIFFTEKTFKPILAGQPFFLISNPGSLETLQQWGYQTFSKWWDESYDVEVDLNKRVNMIMKEIMRLSVLTIDELKKIRNDMSVVLKHNQDLFISNRSLNIEDRNKPLYDTVKTIWNSF